MSGVFLVTWATGSEATVLVPKVLLRAFVWVLTRNGIYFRIERMEGADMGPIPRDICPKLAE